MNKFQNNLPNGQYGIESLEKVVDAANDMYDLVDLTYGDDKKWGQDDWLDVIGKGPSAIQSVIRAANEKDNLDEEILDLSEVEKATLVSRAGERINKPGYLKVFRGILEIVDGISELKNPDNPTA